MKTEGRAEDREFRKLNKGLQVLTDQVLLFVDAVDASFMADRSIPREASSRLARLVNALDLANDHARYFVLGVDYRTDDKRKAVERLKRKAAKR